MYTPELPAYNYSLLHFINFDRYVWSKACLKDGNDPKFVSDSISCSIIHALMARCTEKLL